MGRPKKTLTPKQARFVDEYLIDLNATAAATRAGYSEKTAYQQGSRLLSNVEVAAAVTAAQEKRAERTQINADRVLQELARIGFADIRNLFEWDERRAAFVPSRELTEDQAAAISEINSETLVSRDENGQPRAKIKLKLKTYDKVAALRDIGKHLGMFAEDVNLRTPDGPLAVLVTRRVVHPDANGQS